MFKNVEFLLEIYWQVHLEETICLLFLWRLCPQPPEARDMGLEPIFRHVSAEILPKNFRNLFIVVRLCT